MPHGRREDTAWVYDRARITPPFLPENSSRPNGSVSLRHRYQQEIPCGNIHFLCRMANSCQESEPSFSGSPNPFMAPNMQVIQHPILFRLSFKIVSAAIHYQASIRLPSALKTTRVTGVYAARSSRGQFESSSSFLWELSGGS